MKQFTLFIISIFITIFLMSCQQNLTAKHSLEEVLPHVETFIDQDVTHESTLPLFEGTTISYEINDQVIDDLKTLERPIYDQYMDIEVVIYARDETFKIIDQIYVLSAYSPKHNYEIHLNDVDFENIQKETFSKTFISLYQNDTKLYEVLGNIRGRGNSNWFTYDKKSYRISFDQDIDMMGLRPHHDYILIGMAADKSLMRDVLAHQLSHMLSLEITQETRYVSLYVNGDYHGLYALIEDRTYIKSNEDPLTFALELDHRIDWEPSDDIFIRVDGAPYAIKRSANLEADTLLTIETYLENVLNDLRNGIIHPDIDLTNWARYMMIQEIFKNVDAWGLSVFMYRENNTLKFGPVWDFDFALGNADYVGDDYYNPEGFFLAFDPRMAWFFTMIELDAFQDMFKKEMLYYYNEILPQFLTLIEVLGVSLIPYAEANFERWNTFNTYLWPNPMFMVEFESFADHILWNKTFIYERSIWYRDAMFRQPFI